MEDSIQSFIRHLREQRNITDNTALAYARDIRQFLAFSAGRGAAAVADITATQVAAYLLWMKTDKAAPASINRRMSTLRAFSDYLRGKGIWQVDPTAGLRSPRVERKPLVYLSEGEVDQLLRLPGDHPRGRRDQAVLELLYATGVQVSEAVELDLSDINLSIGYVMAGGARPRIIPLGRPARQALTAYVETVRPALVKKHPEEAAVFVNLDGGRLTRQGLWKIIREYGKATSFADRLTPQTLRNTFAVHLVQNGADLKSLKELMGQEDAAAAQIYLGVSRNRVKEVYDKAFPRA